jgi:hypothetical protein
MAEQQDKQEGQKTIVSFVAGLLIGGLLVWAFSAPDNDQKMSSDNSKPVITEQSDDNEEVSETDTTPNEPDDTTSDRPVLPVGNGSVNVANQNASNRVTLSGVIFPISEGWIGVREYNTGQLGHLLGVVRFSEEQGIVPSEIYLQRSTTAGREYAVVIYTDNGDRSFNLAEDVQIDQIFATFTAQ